MKIDLKKKPVQFLWGTATSSHQIEGYNNNNDWSLWENDGRIEGGAKCGAATNHWNCSRKDLELAANLNTNTYRFSIEWSRVEPRENEWNEAAIQWYKKLIDDCVELGLVPMVTLHHFTSPIWFTEIGGFANEDASFYFERFVNRIVREIGAQVPLWCTINEPMVMLLGGYIGKFMPPGIFAPKLVPKVFQNLMDCHLKAYSTIHGALDENRDGAFSEHPLMVGLAQNVIDFLPDRKWHLIELILSRVFHRFYNWSFLDCLMGRSRSIGIPGIFPSKVIDVPKEQIGKIDFVGVNYYTKGYVKWNPRDSGGESISEVPLGISFARRKETQSDLEWAIHPDGMKKLLIRAAKYDRPIYITENGIADRLDKNRKKFVLSHIETIAKLIEYGMDIRGYYYWSLLDNFEWIKGFGPRFGLYRVDYDDFSRTPTESANFYKKLISSHNQGPPTRSLLDLHRADV